MTEQLQYKEAAALTEQRKVIFFESKQSVVLHFTQFGRHSAALNGKIVRQLLPVKRNIE